MKIQGVRMDQSRIEPAAVINCVTYRQERRPLTNDITLRRYEGS